MLEIRHVTKIYRSKSGVSTRALDDLSLRFPERGMVIILGKSGSGKSTLLNVIGGLDRMDEGEILIRGRSSANFTGADFDAYRNTFIGFIFQEYNILEDFTVGANIALALELQGRKADSAAVEQILSRVDLLGYADRKPNELSGGQKQRVAIARALVKSPEIIMADEPTGALDSTTGKAIFDALKELSKEKLVIVVSHDREFAEKYADRIVELSDGRILSDVTRQTVEGEKISDGIDRVSGDLIRIKGGYRLTDEDVRQINAYLAAHKGDLFLSGDGRLNAGIRASAGIGEEGAASSFSQTKEDDAPYVGAPPKFIPSRLPMKNAIRIGASGLKYKKFRLVMTIFLSLIAFALFGIADTMAAYNKKQAAEDSILSSGVSYASFRAEVKCSYDGGDETFYFKDKLNDEDLARLKEKTGLEFVPVVSENLSLYGYLTDPSLLGGRTINTAITGIVSMDAAAVARSGMPLFGRMPEADNEIVITKWNAEAFRSCGFQNSDRGEAIAAGAMTYEEGGENSILGKHLGEYTIVGVLDTRFDYDRYAPVLSPDRIGEGFDVAGMLLMSEMGEVLWYGFHQLAFVTPAVGQARAKAQMGEPATVDENGYDVYGKKFAVRHDGGIYDFATAPMPSDRAVVRRLVELNYTDEPVAYRMQNSVMNTLNSFDELITTLAKVFVWIGLFFAVFASLLLMNFISVSISHKKREIGILRAVGARSADVFRIFWSEATIIALINSVLAAVATLLIVGAINRGMADEGITVTLLHFGIRQILLLLGVPFLSALLASFLPVYHIAKKRPVDAIKNA